MYHTPIVITKVKKMDKQVVKGGLKLKGGLEGLDKKEKKKKKEKWEKRRNPMILRHQKSPTKGANGMAR